MTDGRSFHHEPDGPGGPDRLLVKQPNSKDCFVCGLRNRYGLAIHFYSVGPGKVEANYTVPARYQGYPGVVHGGVVAAMLDEIVGRVTMTDDPNHFLVTAKLELRYRAPVPVSQRLVLRGWLLEQRRKAYRAAAELRLPDGTPLAEAEAVLMDYPGTLATPDLLESLGWRIYPE